MNLAHELAKWGPTALAQMPLPPTLAQAQAYCRQLARSHYENFVVVGLFTPPALRPAFDAIYGYCRWADDLGDETGDTRQSEALLTWWLAQLDEIYHQTGPPPKHPVFIALQPVVKQFQIPQKPFQDLVSAFLQDQHVTRYQDLAQLSDYCARSANPVGELVLRLFGAATPENLAMSNDICTGLQLANFWQDVSRDLLKNRVYLPQGSLQRFGLTEADLTKTPASKAFRQMLAEEVAATQSLFDRGEPLTRKLPGRAGLALRLFHAGGVATLSAIRRVDYDVLTSRPRLGKIKQLGLMCKIIGRTIIGR